MCHTGMCHSDGLHVAGVRRIAWSLVHTWEIADALVMGYRIELPELPELPGD